MCRSSLHEFLIALPKVEHHCHIEGTLETDLLFSLAEKNGVTLPIATSPEFASPGALREKYKNFTSLDDFLHFYYIGMSVLLHPSDYEALAWAYFTRVSSENMKHAELFFDPQAHLSRGVQLETIIEGFESAKKRAEEELDITSLFTPCLLRHLPVEDCRAAYELLVPHLESKRLAGIGLCSSEKDFPPSLFSEIFQDAKKRGFRRTGHAGEESGPENVRAALKDLDIQRIDHGISIARDEELLRDIASSKILVTVCPMSNVAANNVKDMKSLPIREFLNAGVRFSVNSDDPAYFGGYIQENYCAIQDVFDITFEGWVTIVEGCIEGSWCSLDRKEELKKSLKIVIEKYETNTGLRKAE